MALGLYIFKNDFVLFILWFQSTPSLLFTLFCHPLDPNYSNKQYETTLGQSAGLLAFSQGSRTFIVHLNTNIFAYLIQFYDTDLSCHKISQSPIVTQRPKNINRSPPFYQIMDRSWHYCSDDCFCKHTQLSASISFSPPIHQS